MIASPALRLFRLFRGRSFRGPSRAGALFVACAFVLGSASAGPAAARANPWFAASAPVRIMALGDSITAGVGEAGIDTGSGGYRGALQRLLDARGYKYEMVGGRSDYSARVRMRSHEGWPGYVIRAFPSDRAPQLYGAVTRHAIESYDPDVILLMAGTNDLLRLAKHRPGYTLPNIVESLHALLAQIFYLKPDAKVIVAGVVDSPRVHECDVAAFDGIDDVPGCAAGQARNMRTVAADFASRGFDIELAPGMSVAVPRDKEHFPDGIHPSGAGGYDAMARVWLAAIENRSELDANGMLEAAR
jgi:lysophospholipase L1-like esterase